MLRKYAQEISEYLSSMMGRSIIITDVNGIIIGSPAKERIGDFHPPSVPCVKYKKMSFDDKEAAQKLGVWYPGSTVPLFYNDEVIGTAAIAGEPAVVLQFTMLVKKQIESILREKVLSFSAGFSQREVNALVEDIGKFNGLNDSFDSLTSRARRLGFQLDMPRGVMAICFSNFRGLGLEKNPVKLLYEQYNDPISEELDYLSTHGRLIELIREVFSDPQTIIASAARDKLSVIYAETARETDRTYAVSQDAIDRAWEIYEKLKEVSIETKIGLSPLGLNIYEIPASYKNAWEVVEIADRTGSPPGVYSFDQLLFEEITFNINRHYSMQFIEKKLLRLFADDANELAVTFKVYCESSFRKQAAAEALHLHRNTLAYRLRRIENLLGISMDDFKIVSAYYLTLCRMELYGMK